MKRYKIARDLQYSDHFPKKSFGTAISSTGLDITVIYPRPASDYHSARMLLGAYDPVLMMTQGYQISTSNATKFTYIGV